MSLYRVSSIPVNHIEKYREELQSNPTTNLSTSYGIDSPLGLVLSNISFPFYLYATLRGKFQVWNKVLNNIVKSIDLNEPCLDCGCGRGMVLIQIARLKKQFAIDSNETHVVSPVYGIDIFNSSDQTSNSPYSTFKNVLNEDLLDYCVLHTANILNLPFKDDSFRLVTSSLVIHNLSSRGDKQGAIKECARVIKSGGWLIIIDLLGNITLYGNTLKELGWNDIQIQSAGIQMLFGIWPSYILKAQKPLLDR